MNQREIEVHLASTGWTRSDPQVKQVSFTKDIALKGDTRPTRTMRVRFNKKTITIEARSLASRYWIRVGGDYFSNIKTRPDGAMIVISYVFPPA